MKIHIKSSLTFLLITMILLVGVTAISAADVDNTQTQEIVKHTEVSTTSYDTISQDVQAETVKTDNNLNEEEKTIEKVNNTKTNKNTITKSPTIQSSNAAVKKVPDSSQAGYIYCSPYAKPQNNQWGQYIGDIEPTNGKRLGNREGAIGSITNPTSVYQATKLVGNGGVILLMIDDDLTETVYETRANAVWLNHDQNHPSGSQQGVNTFTYMGEMNENGKTVVWSGLTNKTNMLSVSEGFDITVQNIVFRDGNASGIPDGIMGRNGDTASVGGAIDNRGTLHVKNCTFLRIYANENGGAIANYDHANTIIEDCIFDTIDSTNDTNQGHESSGQYFGGAISAIRTQDNYMPVVTVKNSNFTNIVGDYGSVFLNNECKFTVENVNINNSIANIEGGAIVNIDGELSVTNVNMTNLQAANYGGAVANLGGRVTIENLNVTNANTTSSGSESQLYGGTIFNNGTNSILTIKDSSFNNVSADFGAAFSNVGGTLTIENTNISDAHAQSEGGAIVNKGGSTTISNVNMTDLESKEYGGAVANLGGNVELDHVNINNVTISAGGSYTMYGGTIYSGNGGNTIVSHSTINDTRAYNGAVFNVGEYGMGGLLKKTFDRFSSPAGRFEPAFSPCWNALD